MEAEKEKKKKIEMKNEFGWHQYRQNPPLVHGKKRAVRKNSGIGKLLLPLYPFL